MGFVKSVLGEINHLVINFVSHFFINSVFNAAGNSLFISVNKCLTLFFHDIQFLLGHGTAQKIASPQGKAAKALHDLHYLLLINDTAMGRLQNRLQLRTIIMDCIRSVLSSDVLRNKIHRTRTVQGNSGDYILQAMGL